MKGTRAFVDVGGVLHTGRELEIREALFLPEFGSFTFPGPLQVVLLVRRVGGGLDVRGDVSGMVEGPCGRCLDDVRIDLDVGIEERIDPSAPDEDPLGENNVLNGDQLDLQDLVRQVIDSALPLSIVCSDACAGLCPTCGHKRDGTCRCPQPE